MSDDIELTPSQQKAFDSLVSFVRPGNKDRVFVLKGYAGTGKTTLMRFLVKELHKRKQTVMLLTPTGRAAKVLSDLSHQRADTIHHILYDFAGMNRNVTDKELEEYKNHIEASGQIFLVFDSKTIDASASDKDTIYIIDEASMISDTVQKDVTQAQFGDGRLLTALLHFDQRPNSKFIFIGDPCQLPPVNGTGSPALSPDYIKGTFKLKVAEAYLTDIVRQGSGNDIINAASDLRSSCDKAPVNDSCYGSNTVFGSVRFKGYNNIIINRLPPYNKYEKGALKRVQDAAGYGLVDQYVADVRRHGYNNSICLCGSNNQCSKLSSYVRQKLGYRRVVERDDLLMVIQNNSCGLVNGDMVQVIETADNAIWHASLSFRHAVVQEIASGAKYEVLLLEDTLASKTLGLDSTRQTSLYIDFVYRMKNKGIRQNSQQFNEQLKKDPFLNALRCMYGYAVTCHKAQGGEWNNVYLFPQRNIMINPVKASYQWMYTAVTRAKEKLFITDDFYIK